jgi:hypothetical protein
LNASNKLLAITALLSLLLPAARAEAQGVTVNGQALEISTQRALESHYQTRLVPGRYWYDPVSGLWGREDGPSEGQIAPGLELGGPLAATASVKTSQGRTLVYVNGREIHARELASLRILFGTVPAGRYWMNAQGIVGYERGPPLFDLRAAAMARAPRNSDGSYGHRGAFGNTASDGNCAYYNDPASGASVITGRC